MLVIFTVHCMNDHHRFSCKPLSPPDPTLESYFHLVNSTRLYRGGILNRCWNVLTCIYSHHVYEPVSAQKQQRYRRIATRQWQRLYSIDPFIPPATYYNSVFLIALSIRERAQRQPIKWLPHRTSMRRVVRSQRRRRRRWH